MPAYGTVRGLRVQVLGEHNARPACRVCGGEEYVDDGPCPACTDGREARSVRYARVGWLEGPDKGKWGEVPVAALQRDPVSA